MFRDLAAVEPARVRTALSKGRADAAYSRHMASLLGLPGRGGGGGDDGDDQEVLEELLLEGLLGGPGQGQQGAGEVPAGVAGVAGAGAEAAAVLPGLVWRREPERLRRARKMAREHLGIGKVLPSV